MLCVGRSSSFTLVTLLGSNFDAKVLTWMDSLVPIIVGYFIVMCTCIIRGVLTIEAY